MSELFDRESNWWNLPLIQEIFSAEEAGLICSMAVCPCREDDGMIWQCTRNGEYSVRSAYHLAKEKYEVDKGSCSNRDRTKQLWRAIWNIDAPRAVKVFLRKTCSEILPTRDKLFNKSNTPDPLCPIYNLEVETTGHILWSCPSARDVWTECSRKIQKSSSIEMDFMSIMENMLAKSAAEELQLAVIVARQIWLQRNSMAFEGKFTSPQAILRTAKDQLDAHLSAVRRSCKRRDVPRRPTAVPW